MTTNDIINFIQSFCDLNDDSICEGCPFEDENGTCLNDMISLADDDYYKWHDRTKDLNDVPKVDKPTWVQVCCLTPEHEKAYGELLFNDESDISRGYYNLIAWRYIEPFESEVEK